MPLNPEHPWAWERPPESSQAISEEVALARQTAEAQPGNPTGWLYLANLLPEHRIDEALAAVDNVLASEPQHAGAHETRARILTRAGRFEEALEACQPEALRGQIPPSLEARAAWVLRARGRSKEAVEKMRTVAGQAPDLPFAWEMLAAWSRDQKDYPAAHEAAQRLAGLEPDLARAHACVAQAEQDLGHRTEALAAWQRAWGVDPSFEYAAEKVLELQMAAKDYAATEATLARLRTDLPGARTLLNELRYRCLRKDTAGAIEVFAQLLCTPDPAHAALPAAVKPLRDLPCAREAVRCLEQHLENPGLQPEAGTCYAELLEAARDPARDKKVRAIPVNWPLGRAARIALLHIAGELESREIVQDLLTAERPMLLANTQLWAAVGQALIQAKDTPEARRWLADWSKRADVEPWMLQQVATAFHAVGDTASAMAAIEQALTLPRDGSQNYHRAWMVLHSALNRNLDEWKKHRELLAHDQLSDYETAILVLARGVADVLAAPRPKRAEVFEEARGKLRKDKYERFYFYPELAPYLKRSMELMSEVSGERYSPERWRRSFNSSAPRRPARLYSAKVTGPAIILVILLILRILRVFVIFR
jgi:cellulose synthase operon protein C